MSDANPQQNEVSNESYEHDFQPPQRRQKILLRFAFGVFAVVGLLVWLMARGPSPDNLAERIVMEAREMLPDGALNANQVQAAAGEYQRALNFSPENPLALEAEEELRQRTSGQIQAHIEQGELAQAEAMFSAASVEWADARDFSEDGTLWRNIERLQEERQIAEELAQLVADAQEALTSEEMDGEDLVLIREALDQLRAALDRAPDNQQIHSMQASVREDLVAATRQQLDTGATGQAEQLLDLARNEWGNDAAINQLREELSVKIEGLEREAELERLISTGYQQLAVNRLTTPAGDSAADWFRQALELDENNERATEGLSRVAEQYALLIANSTNDREFTRARDLLLRLGELDPEHGSIDGLREEIEQGEAAERLASSEPVAPEPESVAPPPPSADTLLISDDDEGRLWSAVRELCDEAQLRRYMERYPDGRYIEEAWQRRSECLEAASARLPQ